MSAKLNPQEWNELNAVIAKTKPSAVGTPMYLYALTLKGLTGQVITPLTEARAALIQSRGWMQIGERQYTVTSIEQGEQIL